MVIKRRGAVFAVVALMMCVAVYLNWSYSRDVDDELVIAEGLDTAKTLGEAKYVDGAAKIDLPGGSVEAAAEASEPSDYFSQARLSRQKARDEAISILKTTTDSGSATKEDKEKATAEISVLAQNAVREARIENLVRAKGYEECVAFINETGINVIVAATETGLTAEDAAKIKDIASSETKLKSDKIKIVEAKKG